MPEGDSITRLNAALEGRYRVERELGEGGMATVYLATDLRHDRDVALKVLKPELAAVVGSERFLAEIETTAKLHHPHILPLFDSGEADDFLFYVMPYVEGESLRDRLDREHQLPIDEAVRLTADIAGALHYAHGRGVIHRDIKPANILLSEAGEPLVADFGIALAVRSGGDRLTETGLSLGTPHYMSPEQATGDVTVGPQTDVYAVGCMLYEMLVGEPPFTGSTPRAILGKIITGAAPRARVERPTVPEHLDAVVRCALEKVPADRFGGVGELADALSDPGFRHGQPAGAGTGMEGSNGWTRLLVGFVAGVVVAGSLLLWLAWRPPEVRPANTFALALPEGRRVGTANGFAVSPDGRTVVVQDAESRLLYRRDLASLHAVPIPGTELGFNPFFSPDGEWVGFIHLTEHVLYKVRPDGTERTLLVSDVPPASRSAVWNPDGTIVYTSTTLDGLWRVRDTGGEPERIPDTEGQTFYWMGGLPGGRAVLAGMPDTAAASAGAWRSVSVSLDSGERVELADGQWPRYVATGHLVFWREGSIWAVPFDPDGLQVEGAPIRVVADVSGSSTNGYAFFEVGGGTLLYGNAEVIGGQQGGIPVWVDRTGAEEVVNPDVASLLRHPAVSPDGRRIAFADEPDGALSGRIWVHESSPGGGTLSPVAAFDGFDAHPSWSPDGREVAFSSSRSGIYNGLYARAWDQSSEERLLRPAQTGGLYEARWTDDGRLFYRVGDGMTTLQRDLWTAIAQPDSAALPLLDTSAQERNPAPSPDGEVLAYTSGESGRTEVYVRDLEGDGGRVAVSQRGGINPVWSPTGDELFYIDLGGELPALTSATISRESDLRVVSRETLLSWEGYLLDTEHPQWDVAPDGQRFVVIRASEDDTSRTTFVIVENFASLLRDIAPE